MSFLDNQLLKLMLKWKERIENRENISSKMASNPLQYGGGTVAANHNGQMAVSGQTVASGQTAMSGQQ